METFPLPDQDFERNSDEINGLLQAIRQKNADNLNENHVGVMVKTDGSESPRNARVHVEFSARTHAGFMIARIMNERGWQLCDTWQKYPDEGTATIQQTYELPDSSEKVVVGNAWIDRQRAEELYPEYI